MKVKNEHTHTHTHSLEDSISVKTMTAFPLLIPTTTFNLTSWTD